MDDYSYGRPHLSGDLKWRQAEMRGIIIFPMMQQLTLLDFPMFSGAVHILIRIYVSSRQVPKTGI